MLGSRSSYARSSHSRRGPDPRHGCTGSPGGSSPCRRASRTALPGRPPAASLRRVAGLRIASVQGARQFGIAAEVPLLDGERLVQHAFPEQRLKQRRAGNRRVGLQFLSGARRRDRFVVPARTKKTWLESSEPSG